MSNKIEGVPEGYELIGFGIPKPMQPVLLASGRLVEWWPEARCFKDGEKWTLLRKLPTPLKVEAGKYYETIDGKVVGPIQQWKDSSTWWDGSTGTGVWATSGEHYPNTKTRSLVKEVPPPKPTYRPFVSVDEFKPHRDKWLVPKECSEPKDLCFKVDAYCDKGYDTRSGLIGWPSMFRDFQFEDGTPCGIKQ
jgi:hypothetical protein